MPSGTTSAIVSSASAGSSGEGCVSGRGGGMAAAGAVALVRAATRRSALDGLAFRATTGSRAPGDGLGGRCCGRCSRGGAERTSWRRSRASSRCGPFRQAPPCARAGSRSPGTGRRPEVARDEHLAVIADDHLRDGHRLGGRVLQTLIEGRHPGMRQYRAVHLQRVGPARSHRLRGDRAGQQPAGADGLRRGPEHRCGQCPGGDIEHAVVAAALD